MEELALKSLFDVEGWDNLEDRCKHPSIVTIINTNVQKYITVNVHDSMRKLDHIGKLLQLAYSGSKGHTCSMYVLQSLSRYQDVIKKSSLTTTTFVQVALEALKYHNLALIMTDKEKKEGALKMIEKCPALAERMAEETDQLLTKVDELCMLSKSALEETTKNQNITEKERKEIIKVQKEKLAEQKNLEAQVKYLAEAASEVREEAKTARKLADQEENSRSWIWMIVFLILSFFGLAEQVETASIIYREKEMDADKKRLEYEEKQRSTNADLAKVVEQLKNLSIEEDELPNAVEALKNVVKMLSDVKTVFFNVKVFWGGVSKQCKSLSRKVASAKEMLQEKKQIINAIKESGYCWLAMGKINRDAALAIRIVDGNVDSIMSDLPTKEEAVRLVKNIETYILEAKEIDNSQIHIEEISNHTN